MFAGIPTAVTSAITLMNEAIASALQDAGGIIADISASDLAAVNTAIAAAQSAVAVMVSSTDSATAATGQDVLAYINKIGQIINSSTAASQTLNLINPNLFRLAAQYLGDVTRWQEIASLSGLLDPQPIGTFQVLIPAS